MRIEDLVNADGEIRQEFGSGLLATMKDAVLAVARSIKRQNRDGLIELIERIHDPVFRDARLRILASLLLNVALWMIGADDLDHQVGPQPELILRSWISFIQHEQEIWLTKGSRPYLETQRRKVHISTICRMT